MPLPVDVGRSLERLRTLLSLLPPKAPVTGSPYPFEGFIPDEDWVEKTGSLQGSVNHTLEVAFGSRATAGNAPIELKSHGTDLLAVVDVPATSITGHNGENPILIKWVGDLISATEAVKGDIDVESGSLGKRVRKYTEKREQMEKDNEAKTTAKRKKVEEAAQMEKAKQRTAGNVFNRTLLLTKSDCQ
ncbi:hypothetical protein RSAG8_13519, partial [Rhizoctonia solani AG-8 WAC10335]